MDHTLSMDGESNTSADDLFALVNSTGGENATETGTCKVFRFVLYTVCCGLLCLLGVVGNSVSLVVLSRDASVGRVAAFLLQAMAVADNLFLTLWFIHYSVRDILRYWNINGQQHPVWIYIRVYTFPFLYMTQMHTIWLTVVVAMNRYMAICLPYRAPHMCTIHNVYKAVAGVTLVSVIYNVPRFFELTVTRGGGGGTAWRRTRLGADGLYNTVYTDAMYYIFTFVLPLLILAFANTRVIIAYRAISRRKRQMTSSSRRRRQEDGGGGEANITLVMIVVVGAFMVCQAPARAVQLVWGYSYSHCHDYQYYLIHISNSLEVLNSSINFLIYFVCRKRFRDILGEYYCNYRPSSGRRNSARSATTEAFALNEYQATVKETKYRGAARSEAAAVMDPLANKQRPDDCRLAAAE